jgi:sugar lactone lactonase YvrE
MSTRPPRSRHPALLALAAALAAGALAAGAPPAAAQGRRVQPELGDSNVRFAIPSEGYPGDLGYPEGIVINGNQAFVSTPATFGTSGSAPSKIYAFDVRTGVLTGEFVIEGQDLSQEHALSGMTLDGSDRLYVLDIQQGVLRLTLDGQSQEVYAPAFPDLPANAHGDQPPLPNDLTFDDQGYLYVTDTLQGVIWRIPPGGGSAELWFSDARLDTPFGPNGIRVSPDRTRLFFGVTTDDFGAGTIYTLPLVESPSAEDLEVFHVYWGEGPDGLGFGASGKLYVTLAFSNVVSVLGPDGSEVARYAGPAATQDGGAIPWDAPATFAFDNRTGRLLIVNHALFSGIPEHFVVFDLYVDDRVDPVPQPNVP